LNKGYGHIGPKSCESKEHRQNKNCNQTTLPQMFYICVVHLFTLNVFCSKRIVVESPCSFAAYETFQLKLAKLAILQQFRHCFVKKVSRSMQHFDKKI